MPNGRGSLFLWKDLLQVSTPTYGRQPQYKTGVLGASMTLNEGFTKPTLFLYVARENGVLLRLVEAKSRTIRVRLFYFASKAKPPLFLLFHEGAQRTLN